MKNDRISLTSCGFTWKENKQHFIALQKENIIYSDTSGVIIHQINHIYLPDIQTRYKYGLKWINNLEHTGSSDGSYD